MNDPIDRQTAIDAHYEYCNKHPDAGFPVWSLKILENLPSEQFEIIRCKDCKHGMYDVMCKFYWCHGVAHSADWYCADAERRADEV